MTKRYIKGIQGKSEHTGAIVPDDLDLHHSVHRGTYGHPTGEVAGIL